MANLIDILALELKTWPDGIKEIEQSDRDGELYYNDHDSTGIFFEIACDAGIRQSGGTIVTRSQWQAAVERLNAESAAQQWSGEGLPPVGSQCEVHDNSIGEWCKCVILAHDLDNAVFRCTDHKYTFAYDGCTSGGFRPIRTPEQIEKEARQKAVAGIKKDLQRKQLLISDNLAEALYGAGYRKFEIADDSDPA